MHIFIGMFPKRGRSLHLFMAERKFVFTKHKKIIQSKRCMHKLLLEFIQIHRHANTDTQLWRKYLHKLKLIIQF